MMRNVGWLTGRRNGRFVARGLGLAVALAGSMLWMGFAAGSAGSLALASEGCSNEALRVGLSANLPDCRAYERVSPAYTQGFPVAIPVVSADGSRLILGSYGTFGGLGNAPAGSNGATYELVRESTGWVAHAILPSPENFLSANYFEASADLAKTLWVSHRPTQSIDQIDFYLKETDSGDMRLIGPSVPSSVVNAPPGAFVNLSNAFITTKGESRDLSRLVFSSEARPTSDGELNPLWPGDTTEFGRAGISLYEYVGVGDSEPELVGIRNHGSMASQPHEPGHDPHLNEGAELISDCGTGVGDGQQEAYNAISAGGVDSGETERVFFTAEGKDQLNCLATSAPPVNELYARVNRAAAVAISEPSAGDCEVCQPSLSGPRDAQFNGASSDGSKVYFTTEQELIPGAKGKNLYEYDFNGPIATPAHPAGKITLVSAVNEGEAGVEGVARVSQDGSHVYFVASGLLREGHPGRRGAPVAEGHNLYVFDAATGVSEFIATLGNADPQIWSSFDVGKLVDVTPDGQFAVFTSFAHLTPDDESGPEVSQIFEYAAPTDTLARVSIGQRAAGGYLCPTNGQVEEGYECNGNNVQGSGSIFAESPTYAVSAPSSAASNMVLSPDGRYVVFTSTASLTPLATSSRAGACTNTYEYHVTGGDVSEGNVSLISSGADVAPHARECGGSFNKIEPFLTKEGAAGEGQDVFFEAGDQLTPSVGDTQRDLYDARIDGGFSPVGSPLSCSGDACQGGLAAAPAFAGVGSAAIAGNGNLGLPAPKRAVVKAKSLTRAQQLARALKACKKVAKNRRARCRAKARKRYKAKSNRRGH